MQCSILVGSNCIVQGSGLDQMGKDSSVKHATKAAALVDGFEEGAL